MTEDHGTTTVKLNFVVSCINNAAIINMSFRNILIREKTLNIKPPRAVIVDNDPFYREIFSTCLRTLSWDYGVMESGYELIEHFLHNGESFDIAIIETDLPLLDGLATVESVKLFIGQQNIIFTGKTQPSSIPEGSLFIKKPVDFSSLIRFLQSINDSRINGSWQRPESEPAIIGEACA